MTDHDTPSVTVHRRAELGLHSITLSLLVASGKKAMANSLLQSTKTMQNQPPPVCLSQGQRSRGVYRISIVPETFA